VAADRCPHGPQNGRLRGAAARPRCGDHPILRRGNPRDVIVQVATNLKADLLILGSHSKRGLMDIALGGTAQQVGKTAPCPVVLVSPKLAGRGGGRTAI
jgi:nucleotide-binding universal stress UspA family protein